MTDSAGDVYARLWKAWSDGDFARAIALIDDRFDDSWTFPAAVLTDALGPEYEVRSVLTEIRRKSDTEALGMIRACITSKATGEEINLAFAESVRTHQGRIVEMVPVFIGVEPFDEMLFD